MHMYGKAESAARAAPFSVMVSESDWYYYRQTLIPNYRYHSCTILIIYVAITPLISIALQDEWFPTVEIRESPVQ